MSELHTLGSRVGAAPALDIVYPDPPEWIGLALCAETDPEAFFPEPNNKAGNQTALAKKICARCDVKEDCLDYALEHRIGHGLWGGKSAHERARILQGKSPAASRRKDRCVNGHDLVDANVRIAPDGRRVCLPCEATRARDRRARLAAALHGEVAA